MRDRGPRRPNVLSIIRSRYPLCRRLRPDPAPSRIGPAQTMPHVRDAVQVPPSPSKSPLASSTRTPMVGRRAYDRLYPHAPKLICSTAAKPIADFPRKTPFMARTGQDLIARSFHLMGATRTRPRLSRLLRAGVPMDVDFDGREFEVWQLLARATSMPPHARGCGARLGHRDDGSWSQYLEVTPPAIRGCSP